MIPPGLDDSDFHDLAGRWPVLDALMKLAAQDLVFLAVLVGLALWLGRDALRAGLAACLGAGCALGLSGLIGALWDRPRPFVTEHFVPLVSHGADASFPSDHVVVLAALAGAAWGASRAASVAALGLATATGFARDYVGIHWITDCVGALFLGAMCGVAAWYALAPVAPMLSRLDTVLARRHLRPRTSRG